MVTIKLLKATLLDYYIGYVSGSAKCMMPFLSYDRQLSEADIEFQSRLALPNYLCGFVGFITSELLYIA